MATPWLQIGNLVLRNLDTILNVVAPVFTRKKTSPAQLPEPQDVVSTQIAELQAAASSNSDQIRHVAEELRTVVTSLEAAAVEAAAERRRTRALSFFAIGVALVALVAVAYLLATR